ncbi:YeiH family protein [Haloarchaeobius sp. DYHT-AS-18]|uniref:YeiH family protein n=1 Tax=Haloarchaeobius sp. DYHT-AS-18 TaxID=3446117 RepID=UPI003EBBC93E
MTERSEAAPADSPTLVASLWSYLPGVAALVCIGLVARLLSQVVPYVNALIAAVAIGILLGNLVGVPDRLSPGTETHKLWLEAGIVLMGARISLETLLAAGAELALVVAFGVLGTILLVELLAMSLFDIPQKLGSLLAAGAGICGVSAVVGVAGSIRANEEQIAYAAGTILLFDVVTLFVYPAVGEWLGLADRVFGVWAGLTMFSTGPVTAAGFAVSETAGQWATVTKLTRNLLLGGLVAVYSIRYAGRGEAGESTVSVATLWSSFPKFVIGFFAVMVLTSTALVSSADTTQLTNAYRWLFLFAFAGLGLSVDVADLRETGVRPVALVLTTLVLVSVASLFVIQAVLGG